MLRGIILVVLPLLPLLLLLVLECLLKYSVLSWPAVLSQTDLLLHRVDPLSWWLWLLYRLGMGLAVLARESETF